MTIFYLKIEDESAVNRIVADDLLPSDFFPPEEVWVQDDEAQIGWSYDGATFTPPPPIESEEFESAAPMEIPPSREEFDALEARVTALEA